MVLRGDFSSEALHMSTNIQLYVPDKIKPPYRVVYLLHGLHGNQGTWLDYSMLSYFAKDYNAVFVMPEAGRSFYFNQKYGRNYCDYISEELPDMCSRVFNITAEVKYTAVMGCSMGGHGALSMAFKRPDRFGFCGAISPACLYFEPMLDSLRKNAETYCKTGLEADAILKDFRAAYGEDLEYIPDNDVSVLVKKLPADMPKPVIYTTCGTEDELRKECLQFNEDIKDLGFDYTYEEWSGGHEWYFFSAALKKTLEFWYKKQE